MMRTRPSRLLLLLVLAAVTISAHAPAGSAAAAGDVYLFFDPDGVLPGRDLVAAIAATPDARVHAVSEDPHGMFARLLAGEPELLGRVESLGDLAFKPADPAALSLLADAGVRRLPAVIVLRDGHAHVREGAGPIDVEALRRCGGKEPRR